MFNLDYSVIVGALPFLYKGLLYSMQLTVIAALGGGVLGTLLAIARLSPYKSISLAAAAYVNLMRSVPLVLVLFWFYFMIPLLMQWVLRQNQPVSVGAEKSAIITFVLFEAAYFCEIVRAGIQSVSRDQIAAARSMGLSYAKSMRLVVLPQALRNMLPILLTQTIILFQDTSLVYVLSITDLLGAASQVAQRDSRLVEMYLFVALLYLGICWTLSRLVRSLQARVQMIR